MTSRLYQLKDQLKVCRQLAREGVVSVTRPCQSPHLAAPPSLLPWYHVEGLLLSSNPDERGKLLTLFPSPITSADDFNLDAEPDQVSPQKAIRLINHERRILQCRIASQKAASANLARLQILADRTYASLRDLAAEKRHRLEEILALNLLYEEIADLETWINEQTQVAARMDTGRDLSECLMLQRQLAFFVGRVLGPSAIQPITSTLDGQQNDESSQPIATISTETSSLNLGHKHSRTVGQEQSSTTHSAVTRMGKYEGVCEWEKTEGKLTSDDNTIEARDLKEDASLPQEPALFSQETQIFHQLEDLLGPTLVMWDEEDTVDEDDIDAKERKDNKREDKFEFREEMERSGEPKVTCGQDSSFAEKDKVIVPHEKHLGWAKQPVEQIKSALRTTKFLLDDSNSTRFFHPKEHLDDCFSHHADISHLMPDWLNGLAFLTGPAGVLPDWQAGWTPNQPTSPIPLSPPPPPASGTARVAKSIAECRKLIEACHSDAPRIAFWQDRLTETWSDLCELIVTRGQLLQAAAQRHIYLNRCQEVALNIQEKSSEISSRIAREYHAIIAQFRRHAVFERDFQTLKSQVAWVQTAADLLLPRYAGSWRVRLESACDALSAAWSEGNLRLADRHRRLVDSADRSNWLTRQRHLLVWLRVYLAQVNSRRPLTNVAHLACLEEAAELEADQQRRRREERERRHARHRGRRGLDTGQRAMYGRSRKRSQSRQKSPSHKTQQQKQQQQQQQQSQRGRKIWDQRLPQLDKSLFTCRLTLPDADASSTKPASDHPSNTLCQPDLRLWNKPNGAVSRFSRQPSLHETGGRWAGFGCHDVAGVKLTMNLHLSLKAEIDARQESLMTCLLAGVSLYHRMKSRGEHGKILTFEVNEDEDDDGFEEDIYISRLIRMRDEEAFAAGNAWVIDGDDVEEDDEDAEREEEEEEAKEANNLAPQLEISPQYTVGLYTDSLGSGVLSTTIRHVLTGQDKLIVSNKIEDRTKEDYMTEENGDVLGQMCTAKDTSLPPVALSGVEQERADWHETTTSNAIDGTSEAGDEIMFTAGSEISRHDSTKVHIEQAEVLTETQAELASPELPDVPSSLMNLDQTPSPTADQNRSETRLVRIVGSSHEADEAEKQDELVSNKSQDLSMEENGQFGSTKSAAASLGSPAIEVGLTEEAETLKSETKHRKMNVEEQTEDWWARVLDSDQQRLRRRMFRSRPWIKIGLGLQRLARAWFSLIQEWNVQWRELQLMLGVYQFVREVAMAENWLRTNEPYLTSEELGSCLDETVRLLRLHEEFERGLMAQSSRFAGLKRLTELECAEDCLQETGLPRSRSGLGLNLDYPYLSGLIYHQASSLWQPSKGQESPSSSSRLTFPVQFKHSPLINDGDSHPSSTHHTGSRLRTVTETSTSTHFESLLGPSKSAYIQHRVVTDSDRLAGWQQVYLNFLASQGLVPSLVDVETDTRTCMNTIERKLDERARRLRTRWRRFQVLQQKACWSGEGGSAGTSGAEQTGGSGRHGDSPETESSLYSDSETDTFSESSADRRSTDIVLFNEVTGWLWRKHEWLSHTKKSKDRAWHELYTVLSPSNRQLLVYKQSGQYHQENPESFTFRHEKGIHLGRDSVKAAPATDYIKRSNVFRIQVAISGAEYLFQAPTSADLHLWVTAINRACDSDTSRPRQRKLASSPQEIVASTLVAGGCVTQTLATATLLALSASVGLENYGRRRPLGSKCERIGNGQADSDKKTKRIRRIMENARREGKVAIGTTGQRNIKQTQKQRDKEEDKDKERKKISRITLKEKVKEKHKTKEECGENDKVKENEKEYIIGEKMGDQNAQEKSSRRQDTAHEWEAVRGEEERVWKASRWIQLHAESRPSRWRSFRALGHEAKSDCSPTPARSAGRQAQTPESVRTVRSPFSGLAPHLERESSQPSTPCRHTALTADGGGWWLRRQRLLRDTLTWSLSREEPGDLSSPGEGCRRQAAPKEQTQTKGGKMSEDEMGDIGHQECDKEAYEESGWPEAEEAKSGLAKLTRVGAKCPEHGLGEIASAADRTTILCEKSRPLMLSAAAISSFGLKGFRARRLAASMASIDRGAQTGSASHADDRNVHEADDYGHATQPAEWANELEKVTTEAMVAFEAPGKSIISSKAVEQTKATTKCIVTTSKETSTIANLVADSQSAIDASGEPARPSRTRRRRRLTLLLLNYLKLARAHSIGDSSSRGDDESSTGASGRLDSSSPPRRWHRLAVEPEYQSSDQSNWRTDKRGRQEERYREISSTGVNAKHNYGAISHSLDEEPKCLYDTKDLEVMGSYSAMITRRHLFKPDRPGPSIFPTSQQPPTVSATPPPTATAFPAVSACSHAAQFSGIWSQTLPIHRSRLAVSSPTSAGFAVVGSSSVVEAQAVQFAALKAPDATVTAADPAHTNVTIRSLVSQPPSPPTMANPLLASAVSTSQSGPLFARAVRRGQLQEWPATHFSELNQEAGTSRALVPEPSGSPVEAGSTAPISQALPELSEPLPVGHVARAQVDSGQEGRTDGSHVQKDERSQSDAPTMPEPEPHEPISTRLRKFRTSAGEPISPRLRHLFSRQKK